MGSASKQYELGGMPMETFMKLVTHAKLPGVCRFQSRCKWLPGCDYVHMPNDDIDLAGSFFVTFFMLEKRFGCAFRYSIVDIRKGSMTRIYDCAEVHYKQITAHFTDTDVKAQLGWTPACDDFVFKWRRERPIENVPRNDRWGNSKTSSWPTAPSSPPAPPAPSAPVVYFGQSEFPALPVSGDRKLRVAAPSVSLPTTPVRPVSGAQDATADAEDSKSDEYYQTRPVVATESASSDLTRLDSGASALLDEAVRVAAPSTPAAIAQAPQEAAPSATTVGVQPAAPAPSSMISQDVYHPPGLYFHHMRPPVAQVAWGLHMPVHNQYSGYYADASVAVQAQQPGKNESASQDAQINLGVIQACRAMAAARKTLKALLAELAIAKVSAVSVGARSPEHQAAMAKVAGIVADAEAKVAVLQGTVDEAVTAFWEE